MKHKHDYPRRWGRVALIVVISLIVVGGGLGYYLTHDKSRSSIARLNTSSSTKTRISKSSKMSSSTASVSAQTPDRNQVAQSTQEPSQQQNNADIARQYLIGKGFQIMPAAFDGEDPTAAMEEGKAPPNFMHDGAVIFYFKNNTSIRMTGLGNYAGSATHNYTLSKDRVTLFSDIEGPRQGIPYSITNGEVHFDVWNTSSEGHTTTWKIVPDTEAQAYVDGKSIQ